MHSNYLFGAGSKAGEIWVMSSMNGLSECSASEAWEVVQADENAHIIDVRTSVEWEQIGAPDLGDKAHKLHFISWQLPPDMRINHAFLDELAATGIPNNSRLYFLCRSGVRSLAAARAALDAGYSTAINMAEGFEGVAGPDGQRHGGWRGANLPEAPHKTSSD